MTQGARGGASKAHDYGLLGPVETPRYMDAEALWALLQSERAHHAAELEERDRKIAAHEDARASDHEVIARLSRIIRDLQRTTFGARSEKLDPDQLALALEDLEQELAAAEVRLATPAEKAASAARRRANRGCLPAHLPRVEQLIDIEDKTCPCCAGALHRIGEDVAERLDVIPATFRALVIRRPKYGCRTCEEVVVQAPAPARLIEGGLPTEATIAHVVVAKYADHTPLYRQAQMYARRGVVLDRSTLAHWTGSAAELLKPLHARLLEKLKASGKLFADETRAPVLDPGRGRTKLGQLWAYARDDRPWGGPEPPGVAFVYAGDRAAASPALHLAGYRGVLQTDGYGAYKTLAKAGAVELAFCWTHTRRYFHKLLDEKTPAKTPIAAETIARIGQLYAVETEIRGRSPDERRAVRQEKSAPILEALKPWLAARLELISQKSDLAKAIRYVMTHWEGLTRFVDDGRIELDTNTVERAIRPLALTRKNSLFAGSEGGAEHWAVLASLVATCKLNDVEPQAYIEDVITKLVRGHLQNRIDELLPWAYAPRPVAAAA
jgi:transposase